MDFCRHTVVSNNCTILSKLNCTSWATSHWKSSTKSYYRE